MWLLSALLYWATGVPPLETFASGSGAKLPSGQGVSFTYPQPVMLGSYLSYVYFLRTLAGVHRLRWWWPVLGLLGAVLGLMVPAGLVGIVVAHLSR